MIHHEKKEDASWRLVIGICPPSIYLIIMLSVWKMNPIAAMTKITLEVAFLPLKSHMIPTTVAIK
jgi:hypothetical protein